MSLTGDKVGTESGPIRMCVGCRARREQSRLLRFGLRPARDGLDLPAQVTPTLAAPLAGRSAYLCPRRECLDRAIKRRVFTRAFVAGRTGGRTGDASRSIESVSPAVADALWTETTEILRREIDLIREVRQISQVSQVDVIDRRAEKTHAHLRRRGLERLLFELSSQPASSDGRSSTNRQGGTPTHG